MSTWVGVKREAEADGRGSARCTCLQPTLLRSGFDCSWGARGATLYSPGSKTILHEGWRRRQLIRLIGKSLPPVGSTILVT